MSDRSYWTVEEGDGDWIICIDGNAVGRMASKEIAEATAKELERIVYNEVEHRVRHILDAALLDGVSKMNENFCRDCKHRDPWRHPKVCNRFHDLVTGDQLDCIWLRMETGKCGPEGKGYEPKEVK